MFYIGLEKNICYDGLYDSYLVYAYLYRIIF